MSVFVLKIIACISMLFDHLGYVFYGKVSWMNCIGRLAFPIFAFLVTEGYVHTKNLKKYILRMFIFALISQIPFMLFCSIFSTAKEFNVIFTLLFGLIVITIFDKYNKILGVISAVILGLVAEYFKFDYGIYGVSIILIFYIFKNNIKYLSFFFILATICRYIFFVIPLAKYGLIIFLNYLPLYIFLCCSTLCSLMLIIFYNKEQGKKLKYLFYIFYPAHLLLLYLIFTIIY